MGQRQVLPGAGGIVKKRRGTQRVQRLIPSKDDGGGMLIGRGRHKSAYNNYLIF